MNSVFIFSLRVLVLLDRLTRSIVNWTLEIEETAAWRNDCIVHKYSLQ